MDLVHPRLRVEPALHVDSYKFIPIYTNFIRARLVNIIQEAYLSAFVKSVHNFMILGCI